jgi:cell wall-associated NlpC family hydrolase
MAATAFSLIAPVLPGNPNAATAEAATVATAAHSQVSAKDRGSSSSSRAAATRRTVVSKAHSLRGTPYRYGGESPSGFDCSGFTQYVYGRAGKHIPRTASAQRSATKHVSRSEAVPGDLVFFHNSSGRVTHVGIYEGHNKVTHAPHTGSHVKTETIWTSHVSFGRV